MKETGLKRRCDRRSDFELLVALAAVAAVTVDMDPRWASATTQRFLVMGAALLVVLVVAKLMGPSIKARMRSHSAMAKPEAVPAGSPPAVQPAGGQPPSWSRDLLTRLEWQRFEQLCVLYFDTVGSFRAVLKRASEADSRRDTTYIYLLDRIDDEAPPIGVIKCRAGDAARIGIRQVEQLYDRMTAEQGRIALFVTTGDYSEKAEAFARGKRLRLLTADDLLAGLISLPVDTQQSILAKVTQGDYTTPTCPRCGIKMVQRIAKKQMSSSRYFWGCVNHPQCKQTFRLRRGQQAHGHDE